MALTFRYSRECPEGKIFDEEGKKAPLPPSELNGWFDTPAKLHLTQDDLIEAIVKKELASQSTDRSKIEKEYEKATGDTPHFAAKDTTLVKTLDDPKARKRKPK